MNKNYAILRELASKYFEISNSDKNKENILLHKNVNDLKTTQPIVLIDEIPWHEMNINNELTLECDDPYFQGLEMFFKREIFKWTHFPANMVLPSYFGVDKIIYSNSNSTQREYADADKSEDIKSHIYVDQLSTEEDLEKIEFEKITYDEKATKERYNIVANIFGDILPVKIVGAKTGYALGCKTWDDIVTLRGLDNLFFDLIERPEFMHKTVSKFTDIFIDKIRQYNELGLFDGDSYYNQSTAALTNDLHPNYKNTTSNGVWGRGLAQIFASVSPDMHDEFDIKYMMKAMEPFGLVYYGCCEPLHNKIEILEKIPNLRKISITPWADINIAAEKMKNKYVVSAKANPSSVSINELNKEAVKSELTDIVNACSKNGCSCEIILKDITTVMNNPDNIFNWEKIAMNAIK
jgi:hypothetical protein